MSRLMPKFIGALLLLLGTAGSAVAGVPLIKVSSTYSAKAPVVRLGDVALLRGFTPAGRARLAAVELTSAPPVGQPKVLPRAYLKTRIRAEVGPGVKLRLPPTLRIVRASKAFEGPQLAKQFEAAIRKSMPHHPDDVASVRVQQPTRVLVPTGGKIRFTFARGERFDDRVNARLEVVDKTGILSARGVSARVELMRNVFVSVRNLRPGQLVGPNDFEPRRVPASQAPRDAIDDAQWLTDAHVVQAIRAGQPLRSQQVRARPVIKRGAKVRVTVERGTVRLTLRAIAVSSASRGQVVRLRNPSSKKIISARATGDDEARMEL